MLEGADPKDALRGFAEVVRMEPEKGEWCAASILRAALNLARLSLYVAPCGTPCATCLPQRRVAPERPDRGSGRRARGFKALKQIVKLHYKLGNHDDMLRSYRWAALSPLVVHTWNKHTPALTLAAAPSREGASPGRGAECCSGLFTSCSQVGPEALLVDPLHEADMHECMVPGTVMLCLCVGRRYALAGALNWAWCVATLAFSLRKLPWSCTGLRLALTVALSWAMHGHGACLQ